MKKKDEFWMMSVEPNAKYFEGIVTDTHMTMNGNYFMRIEQLEYINYSFETNKFKKNVSKYPFMNILVPHRRERVLEECKKLERGYRYIFKLLKENRSEKYMLAEVFG